MLTVDPSIWAGLTTGEVATRLRQEGDNELPTTDPRTLWSIALDILREPIFLLLVGCGGIYWALGDAQEALILMGFVLFIVGINLYQKQKTEKSLEAANVGPEDTHLQMETRRVVQRLTGIAIAIGITVVVSYGVTRADWLNGILAGLAMPWRFCPTKFPSC